MAIKNRDFFPYVDFFSAENFKLIGECADKKIVLVGKVKGYGDPIVAMCQTDEPNQEELSACDLYELMKFSQLKVNLIEAT